MKKIIMFIIAFFSVQAVFTQDSIDERSKKNIQEIVYKKRQKSNKETNNGDMNLLMQAYLDNKRNKMLQLLLKNSAKVEQVIEMALKLDNKEIVFWLDEIGKMPPSLESRSKSADDL